MLWSLSQCLYAFYACPCPFASISGCVLSTHCHLIFCVTALGLVWFGWFRHVHDAITAKNWRTIYFFSLLQRKRVSLRFVLAFSHILLNLFFFLAFHFDFILFSSLLFSPGDWYRLMIKWNCCKIHGPICLYWITYIIDCTTICPTRRRCTMDKSSICSVWVCWAYRN